MIDWSVEVWSSAYDVCALARFCFALVTDCADDDTESFCSFFWVGVSAASAEPSWASAAVSCVSACVRACWLEVESTSASSWPAFTRWPTLT